MAWMVIHERVCLFESVVTIITEDLLRFSGAGRFSKDHCKLLYSPLIFHCSSTSSLSHCVCHRHSTSKVYVWICTGSNVFYVWCVCVCLCVYRLKCPLCVVCMRMSVCVQVFLCAAVFFAHSSAVKRSCVLLLLSCCCRNTSVPKLLP